MKTISSQKSLILFDQNRSDSNIYALNGVDDIRVFVKPFYESLFAVLAEELKTKQYTSFVKLWRRLCDVKCAELLAKIESLTSKDDAEDVRCSVQTRQNHSHADSQKRQAV